MYHSLNPGTDINLLYTYILQDFMMFIPNLVLGAHAEIRTWL